MTDQLWHIFICSIRLGYDRHLFVDPHVVQRRWLGKYYLLRSWRYLSKVLPSRFTTNLTTSYIQDIVKPKASRILKTLCLSRQVHWCLLNMTFGSGVQHRNYINRWLLKGDKKHSIFVSYFSVSQQFCLLFQIKWASLDWKPSRLFFMARELLNMQMDWSWVQCKDWPFLFGLSF